MSKLKPSNPYAFPCEKDEPGKGMTLRDYFAAKAMQSIITRLGGGPLVRSDEQDTFSMVAEESYNYADAMLKQRQQ